ncbi:MAG TPA: RNA polymerase factor sigma-54 [Phycisphaerae bacterium]|nr:RNA polymerase factor sigma-54 [Phycisphaerae bacterium]
MSQHLSLGLRQEQRLTPQLIQSMNVLQLPLLALEAHVREELERNPALEIDEMDSAPAESAEVPAPPEADDLPGPAEQARENEVLHEAEGFGFLERLSREYDFDDGDRGYSRRPAPTGERDAKMDAMANTASRPVSLNEYLQGQWAFVEVDDRIRQAGELILSYIEEDGYLHTPLEKIAEEHVPPFAPAEMEEALTWVQTLDPPGLGARNLKECLLLQLDAMSGNRDLERLLVENHLSDIEKNRFPAIAKSTGRSIEELKEAVHKLSKLNPHPGHLVVNREVPRIVPDVIVDDAEDGEGYTVRLARGNHPRLRISEMYRRMLAEARQDKQAREFLRKNLESAGALIDAISYRRSRLLEVAEEVVKRQKDFLDNGPSGLKVLRMSELAEKLGCDPSTISRTVADKYVQMPRGIFPLRQFFTGGTEVAGEATSWDSVKARVQEIINGEDRKNPLSDDEVVTRLQAEGIDVSRRTIAKYRQQLRIPPARQRRDF